MSKIVPKLNLNKTPQLVENNSLIMAKNIRLLEDGTIGPDTSLEEVKTKTGNTTEITIHHDAVTETIVNYKYTVLDCDNTVDYHKDPTCLDGVDLNTVAFDFYDYTNQANTNKYVEESYLNQCIVNCYRYNGDEVYPTIETFTYNQNENQLINNGGYRLYLAVYEDYYDEGIDPPVENLERFYYILAPKILLNQNILIRKYTYIVLNPVYQTKDTETIVITEAWDEVVSVTDTPKYLGQIVGLDNKIYFFVEELAIQYSQEAHNEISKKYPNECFVDDKPLDNQEATFDVNNDNYVTRRKILFEDREIAEAIFPVYTDRIKIYEYDEVEKTFTRVKCAWNYSGGKINGCVFKNNTGHNILTICEYDVPNGIKVPIKHIDLNICKLSDNESIYTQNPNIPITNLILTGEYPNTIPAGVYQFFIRYKIDDNRYTSWFPCSKECFAGTKKRTATIQGEIKYIDKHSDSANSFIFDVEHLFPIYNSIYKKFQLGFILSKDDNAIVAREWKEFDLGVNKIYFTTFKSDIKEVNIDDLLETTYEIFNVKHCVNYKNKLYIADYEETDFNPNLQDFASRIHININAYNIGDAVGGLYLNNQLLLSSQNNSNYDYVNTANINNHIRNKWSRTPHFNNNSYSKEYTDFSGYFTLDEYGNYTIQEEHFHIENSNVKEGDSQWCNPTQEDDNDEAWISTRNTYWYNQACILAIYIKSGNNVLHINSSSDRRDHADYAADQYGNSHPEGPTTSPLGRCVNSFASICAEADDYVRNKIAYYNNNDHKWYVKASDNNYYPIDEYYIVYSVNREVDRIHRHIDQYINGEGDPLYYTPDPYIGLIPYEPEFDVVYTQKTTSIIKRTLGFDTSFITYNISNGEQTYPTLLPFTKYNFYVHYVKRNGVTTNGYLINDHDVYLSQYANDLGTVTTSGNVSHYTFGSIINKQEDDNIILYPSFSNIECPPGYVGCFISVAKVGNNVCQLFNVDYKLDKLDNPTAICFADCLELDTLCYTQFDKLEIYNSNGTKVSLDYGKYYDSGNTEDITYFGQCGSVVWEMNTGYLGQNPTHENHNDIFWIVIKTEEVAKRLIKFTPFIKLSSNPETYNNPIDINNIGFVCYVKKLLKDDKYISGNDVYEMDKTDIAGSTASIDLDVLDDNPNDYMLIRSNPINRIKSNFNLEYLNISTDITTKVKSIYINGNGQTILTSMVDSLISSYLYEFNSWYKEYTRKLFNVVEDYKQTIFKNTIRSSRIMPDEVYSTFKFDATDYYHVPVQRGIITNLISIANSIYVHCEHSLFKFSDNKTLNAESEEVTLQENDIFNSGITEVFDAQYGYAGLKKREQSLITYNAYIFYDEVAKTVYAFGGEQQIANISEPIKKLINAINPTDVQFLGDELHNRFFINFKNIDGNVCLSFNFNAKSFISVHDFDFKFGFHSRRNSYLVNDILYNDTTPIGWTIYKIADNIKTRNRRSDTPTPSTDEQAAFNINYIAYQSCYKKSLIRIHDCDDTLIFNEVNSANACVDIICNTEYEKIKVLNYINWICSEIRYYGQGENNVSEEVINRHYPAHKIKIYSDSTETSLFDLLDSDGYPKIANENSQYFDNGHQRANSRAWQYPQYNCGVWSMNYFRDIRNIEDVFDYKNPNNEIIGEAGHETTVDLTPKITRQNLTQENSLLYGKYFVVRFIFNNKNFKLENLILKMSDYEKTK